MASPKCLVCQEDVHDNRSMQGTPKEVLYTDALESYIQSKGLILTAAELVARAQGRDHEQVPPCLW